MSKHVHVALLLAPLLAGCPVEHSSPEGRQLALEAGEEIVDLDEVEVVGELGPPVSEEVNRCGMDELVAADAEGAGCFDGVDAPPPVVDLDGDGVPAENDCDDLDPTVSPDEHEILCNGTDENCNGVDDCDRDGDGYRDVDDPNPDVPETEPLWPPDPPRAP